MNDLVQSQAVFHPASPPSVLAFLLVCAVVVGSLLRGIWLSARRDGQNPLARTTLVAAAVILWLGLAAGLVGSGWVEGGPSRLPLFGAGLMLGSVLFASSPLGGSLAGACSVRWLLAFQGFRLPLELVLHSWVHQGVIPATMTWTGSNWDILSGVCALLLAPWAGRSRAVAWVGNLVGFALLANVARVAVLSAPVPFGWPDVTPKLLLPFHLPYALILPVCVGGALIGHILLTRTLLRRQEPAIPASG